MENKPGRFYVEWWNIRRSTIQVLSAVLVFGLSIGGGVWYASRHNWFIADTSASVPKDSARVISFEGEVRITRAATRETIIITKETYAAPGDLIQTMSDGRATIQMIDGARVQMKPDSTMVIKSSSSLLGRNDVRLSVDDGQVNVRTNEQQGNNIVELAESENRVLSNTDASFSADVQTHGGEIRVSRGGVENTIDGETTVLNENEFAALNGGKMTAHEKLLGPPRPLSPSNSEQIVDNGNGVNVTFTWQDPEGSQATSYRLQISRSPIFASDAILVDRDSLNTREFRLTLTPGTYYWRLKGTARSGQTTGWNDAAKCIVVRGNSSGLMDADSIQVEHVGGSVYIITGHTGPGLLVRSQGRETFAGRDGRFKLQVSSATPETHLEIGDERGNRVGFVISLNDGSILKRY